MNWYINVLKKYAVFSGRASREEYWMFVLFHYIMVFSLYYIGSCIGEESISGIYILATVCPALAVTVRRLHDTNRSGVWALISLIPTVGPIVLLIFMLQGSQIEANQYVVKSKYAIG